MKIEPHNKVSFQKLYNIQPCQDRFMKFIAIVITIVGNNYIFIELFVSFNILSSYIHKKSYIIQMSSSGPGPFQIHSLQLYCQAQGPLSTSS